jgi:hypothetical protein
MEGDVFETIMDVWVRRVVLVYAEVVITARIPYSFRMLAS